MFKQRLFNINLKSIKCVLYILNYVKLIFKLIPLDFKLLYTIINNQFDYLSTYLI